MGLLPVFEVATGKGGGVSTLWQDPDKKAQRRQYALRASLLYAQRGCVQKPNSWTYNFVEVSLDNLGGSQTWDFCMDFTTSVYTERCWMYRHAQRLWRENTLVTEYHGRLLCSSCVLILQHRGFDCLWVRRNRNLDAKLYRWLWIARRKTHKKFGLDFVQEFGLRRQPPPPPNPPMQDVGGIMGRD